MLRKLSIYIFLVSFSLSYKIWASSASSSEEIPLIKKWASINLQPGQLSPLPDTNEIDSAIFGDSSRVEEREKKAILVADGGGIRGVYSATFLAEFEERTKKPIAHLFDVFGGTSTGGIIVGALNIPATFQGTDPTIIPTYDESYGPSYPKFSAQEVLKIYETRGDEIFKKKPCSIFRNAKYSRSGLDHILQQYFGDMRMSESLKPVLLPTYDMSRARPFLLTSHIPEITAGDLHPAMDPSTPRFLMRDAIRATSAAPTFFSPVKIYSIDENNNKTPDHYTMIDGGIYANNPSIPTLEYARRLYPEAAMRDFIMVSLGTGELNTVHSYKKVRKWTLFHWIKPVIEMMMDGSRDMSHMVIESLLNNGIYTNQKQYFRFNNELSKASHGMDDYSSTNIENLKQDAYKVISEKEDDITKLIELLQIQKDPF